MKYNECLFISGQAKCNTYARLLSTLNALRKIVADD